MTALKLEEGIVMLPGVVTDNLDLMPAVIVRDLGNAANDKFYRFDKKSIGALRIDGKSGMVVVNRQSAAFKVRVLL
jgi:hypothetical protein